MEVTFEEVKKLENTNNALIIDVRDPDEIKSTGRIGGSINIPLNTVRQSLQLSSDEFSQKFGKPKPSPDFPIIFSCKLGGRATNAQNIAASLGFTKAKIYKGSWSEWAQKNKL